jgi:hypothetical protein
MLACIVKFLFPKAELLAGLSIHQTLQKYVCILASSIMRVQHYSAGASAVLVRCWCGVSAVLVRCRCGAGASAGASAGAVLVLVLV